LLLYLDYLLLHWINIDASNIVFDKVLPWIGVLGTHEFCSGFLIAFALLSWRSSLKNSRMGLLAASIYGINAGILVLIKYTSNRTRPLYAGLGVIFRPDYLASLAFPSSPGMSFPSGHAVTAFMIATILAQQHLRYRAIFYGIACLVGFSRIYLGLHYPSDVIAGALLGYGITKLVLSSKPIRGVILKESN
jgi:undecaprenyl-diphosphatase